MKCTIKWLNRIIESMEVSKKCIVYKRTYSEDKLGKNIKKEENNPKVAPSPQNQKPSQPTIPANKAPPKSTSNTGT